MWKISRWGYSVAVVAGFAMLLAASQTQTSARQAAADAVRVGRRRHRRRRHEREGAGGRRLGDRGDDRPADEVRQDRRHRRSRALSAARSAEGELQRVGARLRAGRFAEGARRRRARRST